MTLNLAINCSTTWTSIGLSENGTVLAEMNLNIGRGQSSELPKAVEEILRHSGRSLAQVDLFVLTIGPGSFTGVRVGLSYGLALAAARRCQVVPVNTLELMAYQAAAVFRGNVLIPILNAKCGFFYAAAYGFNQETKRLSGFWEPGFYSFSQLDERLSSWEGKALLILEKTKSFPLFSNPGFVYEDYIPSGGRLALLGDLFFERAVAPESVKGVYLRPPDLG
ncbi:MAG TPA: tRNA (adenosine(37)-N6)-threonylcarbamoyltransferase complex dimerization subunit type 1 TsaB [Synergistales bacterium]|nr:tRNA (adenosine(37)-N6)-threonylcarbamoyltransferase complex dimerization subunit type 1 TsaB [Synergistales bacterium]